MRWRDGCFVLDGADENGVERLNKEMQSERTFLELLDAYNQRDRPLSDKPGSNHAPKMFAEDPEAGGTSKKLLIPLNPSAP
jgi:hypothetical protein